MFFTRTASSPVKANKYANWMTLYYFDFKNRGCGEVLRLFFMDAGFTFNDARINIENFGKFKEEHLTGPKAWNPALSVPIVELNGDYLTQIYSILRFFSRKLGGAYDGKTSEDKYFVDLISDIIADFVTLFVTAHFSPDKEDMAKHKAVEVPRYINALEMHISRRSAGPFVLGERVTYEDFLIYQIFHDEGFEVLKNAPALKRLVEAVKARPNISRYLKSSSDLEEGC